MKQIRNEILEDYKGGSSAQCVGGIATAGLLGIEIGSWFGQPLIGGIIGGVIGGLTSCF
ncbi:MAG: hypothetical protein AB1775_06265 [Bacteroidota bacterium]